MEIKIRINLAQIKRNRIQKVLLLYYFILYLFFYNKFKLLFDNYAMIN